MAIDLRDFQQQLWTRIEQSSSAVDQSKHLAFIAGSENWLIDLQDAEALVPLAAVCAVPTTKAWLVGLVNVRGILYTVVDLSLFRGMAPTPRNMNSRLIVLSPRFGINASLLVTQTTGLKNLPTFTARGPVAGTPAWIREQRVDSQGQVFNEIDVGLLVADEKFLHVSAAADAGLKLPQHRTSTQ